MLDEGAEGNATGASSSSATNSTSTSPFAALEEKKKKRNSITKPNNTAKRWSLPTALEALDINTKRWSIDSNSASSVGSFADDEDLMEDPDLRF